MTTKRIGKWVIVLFLLAALPGITAVMAQGQESAGATTLTGHLAILYGDPLTPEGRAITRYNLTTDDGATHRLALGPDSPIDAVALREMNGRRVTVTVDRAGVILGAQGEAQRPPVKGQSAASAVIGNSRWLTIGCKFAGIADEPADQAYLQGMYGNTKPGLNHYWPQVSYGNVNVNNSNAVAWFNLPTSHAGYGCNVHGGCDLDQLLDDCAAAVDPFIYFPDYDGLNLFFNYALDDYAWGTSALLTLDGATQEYRITWEPVGVGISTIYHEMGHGFGFAHSYDTAIYRYGNAWDVMSAANYNCAANADPTYGCIGQNTIGLNLADAGWIPPEQHYVAWGRGPQTITLERTSSPASGNFLVADVPIPGGTGRLLTVEARYRAGYDEKLPGDAVIIHRHTWLDVMDVTQIVDDDGGASDDEGAMWRVGETYTDPTGIKVTVVAKTTTGFRVTIDTPPVSALCESEDNNAQNKADTIALNDRVSGGMNFGGDVDFYKFYVAERGTTVLIDVDAAGGYGAGDIDAAVRLYDAAGTQVAYDDDSSGTLDPLLYRVLEPGWWYVQVEDYANTSTGNYSLSVSTPLLISAAAANLGAASVGGISFRAEDIMAWSKLNDGQEKWVMLVDGSDVGFTKNVMNLSKGWAGHNAPSLAVGFTANVTVTDYAGIVQIVKPWDWMHFNLDQAGSDTVISGREVNRGAWLGLMTTAEKVDALSVEDRWNTGSPRIDRYLSTVGAASVPKPGSVLKAADEDVFRVRELPGTGWVNGAFFDGSRLTGLGVEDVYAMSYDESLNDVYLTILGTGKVEGHPVTQKDIFRIVEDWGGAWDWGSIVWHGPDHGWNYNIDAMEWGGW